MTIDSLIADKVNSFGKFDFSARHLLYQIDAKIQSETKTSRNI